ncbi:MAG: hypothetical protein GX800_05075 [Clostridiaceae bacterium]|jgi:hypothetical protein|nr:hypothetical protein [Clostridiaceae bacterium]
MLGNYIATYLIDISALIFLCYLIYSNNILDQNRKGPFYFGTVLTVLIILSEAGTILAENGNADMRLLSIICNVFGFALTPVIPIILIVIFDANIPKTNKLLLLPSILNMFATVLSPWLGFVFYVDANNHYERGNLFFIFVAAYIINVVILLTSTVMKGKMDRDPVKLEHQLKSIADNLEKERKNDGYLPTIAYGYSIFKGGNKIDFQEVLKEADNRMYYFKKIQKDI